MLTVNQQSKNIGRVKYGEPFNFSYILTNTSSSPITINSIGVGCGSCTRAYCETNEIAPNGTAEVKVTFTPNSTGINNKGITVNYSEKSNHQSLSLKFVAVVYG